MRQNVIKNAPTQPLEKKGQAHCLTNQADGRRKLNPVQVPKNDKPHHDRAMAAVPNG